MVDAEKTERDKRPGNLYKNHFRELQHFILEWRRKRSESSIQEVLHAVKRFPYIDATKKRELDRIAALLRRSMPEPGELATVRAHLETTTTSGNEPSASMMEDDGSTEDRKPNGSSNSNESSNNAPSRGDKGRHEQPSKRTCTLIWVMTALPCCTCGGISGGYPFGRSRGGDPP